MSAAIVGYARVSSTGQSLDVQLDKLTAYGCTKVFARKQRGQNTFPETGNRKNVPRKPYQPLISASKGGRFQ